MSFQESNLVAEHVNHLLPPALILFPSLNVTLLTAELWQEIVRALLTLFRQKKLAKLKLLFSIKDNSEEMGELTRLNHALKFRLLRDLWVYTMKSMEIELWL